MFHAVVLLNGGIKVVFVVIRLKSEATDCCAKGTGTGGVP